MQLAREPFLQVPESSVLIPEFQPHIDEFAADPRVAKFQAICAELSAAEKSYAEAAETLTAAERSALADPFAEDGNAIASRTTKKADAQANLVAADSVRSSLRESAKEMQRALSRDLAQHANAAQSKIALQVAAEIDATEAEFLATVGPMFDKMAGLAEKLHGCSRLQASPSLVFGSIPEPAACPSPSPTVADRLTTFGVPAYQRTAG